MKNRPAPLDLMESRYILENLWPGCQWSVGTIFPGNFERFEIYPYLFRKLSWYEQRKETEMPEYLKINLTSGDHYVNVVKIGDEVFHNFHNGEYLGLRYRLGGGVMCHYLLPATEQEYNDYLSGDYILNLLRKETGQRKALCQKAIDECKKANVLLYRWEWLNEWIYKNASKI